MIFMGIGDEGANGIDGQILATQELGWKHVEPRGVEVPGFAKANFDVFVGSESFLLANMRQGGIGTISATANVNPAAIHKLYTRFVAERDGKLTASPTELEQLQIGLNVAREVFAKTNNMVAALKQAIATGDVHPRRLVTRLTSPLMLFMHAASGTSTFFQASSSAM